jgi:hypothetical protein
MSFPNITALRTYVNNYIIPNGINEITGLEDNTALNGIIDYILNSMVNNGFVHIVSTGGIVVLPAPITLFTSVLPTSIQWNPNFQNEYYIVNGLGVNIPLTAGYSYIDAFGTSQTVIPARTAIHIAQATNGSWIQINNVGNGGSAGLPPETGHNGQFLTNNGTTASWADTHLTLKAVNFQPDGVTYLNPDIGVNYHVSVFAPDIPNFIYAENGQWQYVTGPNGIKLLVPGLNANTNPNMIIELFFKGINTP